VGKVEVQDDLEARVAAIGRETLIPLVQRALNVAVVDVYRWKTRRVHGGTFGVVFRVAGEARLEQETSAWSLILKVVRLGRDDPLERSDPSNLRFWKREPLAYGSGALADLPGGLVAPRCYGVVEQSDHEVWLWLEDVAEEPDTKWPRERYGLVAHHLGQFNGAYLTGRPLPRGAWLGRGLLRAEAANVKPSIGRLPAVEAHPLARRFFPTDVAAGILELWNERQAFLGAIDRLPQTLCHRDAFRRNLFARRSADGVEQTVAIDWEDVAVGPVGEDLVSLVVLSLATFEIEWRAADLFERLVFERYVAGLRDSGWRGDPRLARLGYTAASLRYVFALTSIFLNRVLAEGRRAAQEDRIRGTMEERAEHWATVLRFVLVRINEARRLMGAMR